MGALAASVLLSFAPSSPSVLSPPSLPHLPSSSALILDAKEPSGSHLTRLFSVELHAESILVTCFKLAFLCQFRGAAYATLVVLSGVVARAFSDDASYQACVVEFWILPSGACMF